MRGERGPGDATASAVGEEEDLDWKLDGAKPEISGNGWERPKKNFRRPSAIPVPSRPVRKCFL